MVHASQVAGAAAAATASNSLSAQRPPIRRPRPSGSLYAGAPFPDFSSRDESFLPGSSRRVRRSSTGARIAPPRRQSTNKYHTFPTTPPATPFEQRQSTRGKTGRSWLARLSRPRLVRHDEEAHVGGGHSQGAGDDDASERRQRKRTGGSPHSQDEEATPLPWRQLGLLALLSLAEQTALNSIGPYLPTMVSSFPEIPEGEEGLYVGLLASAFALAQLTTNLFWGYLSDRIGRKPVMLIGTFLLAMCFSCFGFCTTYWQLILVHVAMGLLNGNAAVVPTCLGEVTDKTNQSKAFIWLPVIYSLGSITGPGMGGLLVGTVGGDKYPFLAPNLVDAVLLILSVAVLAIWFEETLEGDDSESAGNTSAPGLGWVTKACHAIMSKVTGKHEAKGENENATQSPGDNDSQGDDERQALLTSDDGRNSDGDSDTVASLTPSQKKSAFRQLANRNTLAVLGTYLVFQLSNISFNSLYPIFASAPPPTGRSLRPGTIGLSLSLAGVATIFFQVFLFQNLKAKMGNLVTYRWSLLGMSVSMALMPWIGYMDSRPSLGIGSGKGWLYGELGFILVIKNICAVGGLSSVMLLITNSAPSHETLGTLQGIAQTLSAAGRSVGPFLSGGLFTLSTHVQPKGEALAWGVFAGVTLAGWVGSWAIRGRGLESAEWEGDDDAPEDEENPSEPGEEVTGRAPYVFDACDVEFVVSNQAMDVGFLLSVVGDEDTANTLSNHGLRLCMHTRVLAAKRGPLLRCIDATLQDDQQTLACRRKACAPFLGKDHWDSDSCPPYQ
ncbi:major facilitator superfamily domain-containing protein [Cladorrhinum sp. PSN332]|nr:major facilitator superfamily domain-containing protein [Cladorrhinum sp. PSN332]